MLGFLNNKLFIPLPGSGEELGYFFNVILVFWIFTPAYSLTHDTTTLE